MKSELLYDNFLDALSEKFPQRSKLTNALTELLFIEKEAIYRRLRKEVPFTFYEIATIAREWDLSIDNIIGLTPSKSRPFQLKLTEHLHPTETDFMMMQHYVDVLKFTGEDPTSKMVDASNILPQSLHMNFEQLAKFYMFKWGYQYGDSSKIIPFQDIVICDRLRQLETDHATLVKNINSVSYLWDNMIFKYFVNDIRYFSSIYMITPEDTELIKQDLLAFIDYTEKLAKDGVFSETGNRVQIYISHINFDTNYSYICTDTFKLSMIKTFIMNAAASMDEKAFDQTKRWIGALKKSSVLISESGERQRIEFFEEQRKLISSL